VRTECMVVVSVLEVYISGKEEIMNYVTGEIELKDFLEIFQVTEHEAMMAVLTMISPGSPGATTANWRANSNFGNSAPETNVLWELMKKAKFRCACGSQVGIQFHHVNGDSTDHATENLKLLCRACHGESEGKKNFNVGPRIAIFAVEYFLEHGKFPTLEKICDHVEIKQLGSYWYMTKFVKLRLSEYAQKIPQN